MSGKECDRRRSQSDLRCYPNICLERLMTAGDPGEELNCEPPECELAINCLSVH